jgi:hypothetical protein
MWTRRFPSSVTVVLPCRVRDATRGAGQICGHGGGMLRSVGPLGRRAPDVLGTRAFRSLANVELDAVTLTQILEPLAIHRTLVEKVFVSSIALNEPKPLVDS